MITTIIDKSDLTDLIIYDPFTEKMSIHFLDTNTTWLYYGVSNDTYYHLITAHSIGEYFNHHVRNNYQCTRIENIY